MAYMRFNGPFKLSLKSFLKISQIAVSTYLKRLAGIRIAPDWDVNMDIGMKFWRHQFTLAMNDKDIQEGKMLFDSLQTETSDRYDVTAIPEHAIPGNWYIPDQITSDATLLYLHGGGYTFYGGMSKRFGEMLAHHTGAKVFAPDYRLTPEHPHPAQAEDALEAWNFLRKSVLASKLVLIGDSAGGHMVLTLLQSLKRLGEQQPALAIGLCPWTDIGDRGKSLHENDVYDMVQGWMAIRFGQWLDPNNRYGRQELSPIYQDYSDCAPIYIQAGGREILHDMIVDFARLQVEENNHVMFDVWPTMPHNFQAMDSTQTASTQANQRIAQVVRFAMGEEQEFKPIKQTSMVSGNCWSGG